MSTRGSPAARSVDLPQLNRVSNRQLAKKAEIVCIRKLFMVLSPDRHFLSSNAFSYLLGLVFFLLTGPASMPRGLSRVPNPGYLDRHDMLPVIVLLLASL